MDLDQLTDEQYLAFEEFKAGHNLFITGPGGVGKSFLINLFVQHSKLQQTSHIYSFLKKRLSPFDYYL